MSFETLKRNRGTNINKIIEAAQASGGGEQKSYVDYEEVPGGLKNRPYEP